MFERVTNSINGVKADANISADSFMELLGCVIDDVIEQNNIEDASILQVKDPRAFLKELYAVLSAVSGLYDANRTMIPQVGGIIADKFPVLEKEIREDKKELGRVSADIERFENKKREKTVERDKLEAKCKHFLELEEENKKLEERIAFLNDPKLDGMAEDNKSLQEELQKRNARKQALEHEKNKLDSQLQEINQTIPVLQRKIDESKRECEENERIKNKKESDIAAMQARIAEFEQWKSELDENNRKLNEEHDKMNATIHTFVNIWSAGNNQHFLQDMLFSDNPLCDVKDYKNIGPWFVGLQEAIQKALSIYQEKLQKVIAESEKLTKEEKGVES